MKKYNLNSFYIISSLKNHYEINKNLIKYIDEMPNNRYRQISKTDWNLPKKLNRNYLTYFFNHIHFFRRVTYSLISIKYTGNIKFIFLKRIYI